MNKIAIFWTALSALVWSYRSTSEDLTGAAQGHGGGQDFSPCSVDTDNCDYDRMYSQEGKEGEQPPDMFFMSPFSILTELNAILFADDMPGPPDLTSAVSGPKEDQAPLFSSTDKHDPEHDRSHDKDDGENEETSLLFFLSRTVKQILKSGGYEGSAHMLETAPTLSYETVRSFVKQWTTSVSSAWGDFSGTRKELRGNWFVLDYLWVFQYYGYIAIARKIYITIASAVKSLADFVCGPVIFTIKTVYRVLSVLLCCCRKRRRAASDRFSISASDLEKFRETDESGNTFYTIPGDFF